MAIEYLGNKRSLLDFIVETIEQRTQLRDAHFVDLFCGTGVVSAAAKNRGWRVTANDWMAICRVLAESQLFNSRAPRFVGLVNLGIISGSTVDRYGKVLEFLNSVPVSEGFMYRNYSPASAALCGHKRMYFTELNAGRIDAIRDQIASWKQHLSRAENALLISDLIRAANSVSNIAGTYGCYLKMWKKRALDKLELRRSEFVSGPTDCQVYQDDAAALIGRISADIVYADPPYTKRQYSAYYHVLETIAAADEPEIEGRTGLRPWQATSSDFCYRRKAPGALKSLLEKCDSEHFFLSYNEDGQIPHETILEILSEHGEVEYFEKPMRRYKSSALPHKGPAVCERLYHRSLTQ